nr:hypothetical protein [Clostridium neonatale]
MTELALAEDREEECLEQIKNSSIENMGSVFFHPAFDNRFIILSEDENKQPIYSYGGDSFLKRLVGILEWKGYRFVGVNEL